MKNKFKIFANILFISLELKNYSIYIENYY